MSAAVDVDAVRRLRHALHGMAERSHEEQRTAARIQAYLEDADLDVDTRIGDHGVMALLGDPPYRLLRADLDALPHGDGARHGCGHDGHMAMLAGAAHRLAFDPPPHGVALFWQSAEEDGSGMQRALGDERLADLEVSRAFAVHNIPGVPLGTVVLGPGALASVGLRLRLTGAESHAAHPQDGNTPWPALCDLADAASGLHEGLGPEALATLVHVRLGVEAYGTSPGTGVVCATLRGSDGDVETMRRTWTQRAEALAAEHGLDLAVEEVDPFPATQNHADAVDLARAAAQEAGLEVLDRTDAFPWSEDFGHAVGRWGGALVGLGSGTDHPPLHDDDYEFPDDLLGPGVRFWEALARCT